MKIFLITLQLTWLTFGIFSQEVFVIDSENKKLISGVEIYCPSLELSVITDSNGKANISGFKNENQIIFKHAIYKNLEFSYKELTFLKFNVEMSLKILSLGDVYIISNRRVHKKIELPNKITTISMKDAQFQNPQTAADLLALSGFAFIQKSQLGGGSPMLRGMATNRVLLVVDGVRMNNAIFRSGNVQNVISIDVNAVDNTEIIFGPGSIMYGSDAIGGVMNFKTLEAEFAKDESKKPYIKGSAISRFSSANIEKTNHVNLNLGYKKIAFFTSFTHADYGDLRAGSVGGNNYFYRPNYVISYDNKDYMVPNQDSTLQIGSKYSQFNFMQKVSYKVNEKLQLDYGFHFSETSKFNRYDRLYVMRTDGPYKDKLRWAEWYYGPQKWQMHRIGVSYTKKNILFDNLKFFAAYQFFEESRYDREFMYKELRMQKENVDAYSINLDFDKKISEKLSVNYGYEFVFNRVHSVASLTHIITKLESSVATRYPDRSTWQSNGAYLTASYKLFPKVVMSGGVRYNHFAINADFDTLFFPFPYSSATLKTGSVSGNLGAVFSPLKSWQIYINGANGFRAPNIDDMGKVFESVPGYLVIPNPDLKPEKVFNAEMGTAKTFGDFLTIDATFYHTWLYDAMIRKNFTLNGDTTINYLGNKSRIQAIQNVARINVYGFQIGADLYYKGLGLKTTLSYQNGKEQTPDSLVFYPLRHAAPTFGSTHITYEFKNKFKLDFYMVYNAKMDYENMALTERTNASYARDSEGRVFVDAWKTFNFKFAYFPHPFISITLGVENITNIMYRPYSSGITAPGRNIITSIRVRF
jgi:hemoglobin/transferrin/lactoferrin receptor protein